MKPEKDDAIQESKNETEFILIFNELAKAEQESPTPEVSIEEINAIEEVSRIVMEVSNERPIFMTST